MEEKPQLFGEQVAPLSNSEMITYALLGVVFGALAIPLGLDAGIIAVTMFTSSALSGMGFPFGFKYMSACVISSLLISMLVKGLLAGIGG